jgi:hypothetical protein
MNFIHRIIVKFMRLSILLQRYLYKDLDKFYFAFLDVSTNFYEFWRFKHISEY